MAAVSVGGVDDAGGGSVVVSIVASGMATGVITMIIVIMGADRAPGTAVVLDGYAYVAIDRSMVAVVSGEDAFGIAGASAGGVATPVGGAGSDPGVAGLDRLRKKEAGEGAGDDD